MAEYGEQMPLFEVEETDEHEFTFGHLAMAKRGQVAKRKLPPLTDVTETNQK